jgi:GT2 family glycosyltransferase
MLLDTVHSVLAAAHLPCEVVVVDQSSAPHGELAHLGTVRGCEVRYAHAPARGLSRARNVGLRLASQDVVWVLDDDVLVQQDSLERLLAGRRGGQRTVTTGRVLAAPPERPGLTQPPGALVTETAPQVFRGRQPRQVVPGLNYAIPRSLLWEIGGWDERLGPGVLGWGGEDHDLSLRLLDAGCEVRHVPEANVLHRSWRSRGDLVRSRWGYGRGAGAFYAKHASMRDRHTLERAAREVRTRLWRAATVAISSPGTAAGQLLALAGLLSGAVEWTLRYRIRPLSG